jgi:transcriptional regulator of acetoin/glycerol metabolism
VSLPQGSPHEGEGRDWSSYGSAAADGPLQSVPAALLALSGSSATATPLPVPEHLQMRGRSYEELQKEILLFALRENGGRRRQAARSLNLSRSTFCDWCKRFGL